MVWAFILAFAAFAVVMVALTQREIARHDREEAAQRKRDLDEILARNDKGDTRP
jgi:hypothetical protein